MTTITNRFVGAGVTLALLLSSTSALAQMPPSGSPGAATVAPNRSPAPPRPSGQARTAEDIARNRAIADQYGLPTDLLTSEEDRWGLPIPRTIEQSILELGVEGARLRAADDAQFCAGLDEIAALNIQIRQADMEVVQARDAVALARTRAERRVAEAALGRAQNNLFQLLGMVVRLGLAAAIPGAGWAYGGYILVSEVTQWSGRRQQNREVSATEALNELALKQAEEFRLNLRAYRLRLEQHDRRGALWDRDVGRWCRAMQPYHVRLVSTSATYTPAPASAATGEHH